MKCPHCLADFHDAEKIEFLDSDDEGNWYVAVCRCAACQKIVIRLAVTQGNPGRAEDDASYLVRPKVAGRPPVSPEVPKVYSEDYKEACLVIADSPKASAALSRRCLQHLLRGEAKVKPANWFTEIDEMLSRGTLPSHIAEGLDAVRNIGNFSAHPMKSKSTGDIVLVEPGEAEWNLDVLESLFDFYFVAPAKTKARKDALNKKLKDAGKPPVK
jgi:hypothetical protein